MRFTVRQYWSFGGIFILKLTKQLNWHFFQQKTLIISFYIIVMTLKQESELPYFML